MKCHFCGESRKTKIAIPAVGIGFGFFGDDFGFCISCLKSMSDYEFWRKMVKEHGYKFPMKLKKVK